MVKTNLMLLSQLHRLFFSGAFFLTLFTVTGCKKKAPDTPVTTVPEELRLSPATGSVVAGSTFSFTATYFNNLGVQAPLPASGIVWSSSNNTVATINQQGVATGVAPGQVTITIIYNSNTKATALLTVTASQVPERITVTATSNSIIAGTTTMLTTTYFNTQGQQAAPPNPISFSSNNASVATVSSTGLVTGIAAGMATITASLNATTTSQIAITVTSSQERLVMAPGNANIMVSSTQAFALTYFNNAGQMAPVPSGVMWSSGATNIATVTQAGVVTGIGAGNTTITASVNGISSSATVTVTANISIATITLNPANFIELTPGTSNTITATAKDASGNTINGVSFTFNSSASTTASIDNTGLVQGIAYGTVNITATAGGIVSPPTMAQVIRAGNFNGPFGAVGTAKIKMVNGVLRLQTASNFSVSTAAPDLRIYLSNNTNNINDAVEVATLNQRTGAQDWAIPSTNTAGQTVAVTFTTYKYVLVWCRQFGGSYGLVTLP
jgi:trimeric autotransporter adhesin